MKKIFKSEVVLTRLDKGSIESATGEKLPFRCAVIRNDKEDPTHYIWDAYYFLDPIAEAATRGLEIVSDPDYQYQTRAFTGSPEVQEELAWLQKSRLSILAGMLNGMKAAFDLHKEELRAAGIEDLDVDPRFPQNEN